jgi:predicted transcriptional regulator
MATPNLSVNHLLRQLKDAIAKPLQVVEHGFMRPAEWGKKWGTSRTHAQKLLAAGYKSGLVERRLFRVKVGRRNYSTFHYREIARVKKPQPPS